MEEKSLMIKGENIFSRFFSKLKSIFSKKSKNFNDTVQTTSKKDIFDIKEKFENGNTSLLDIEYNDLKELDFVYDEQIKYLTEKADWLKNEIEKIDEEMQKLA